MSTLPQTHREGTQQTAVWKPSDAEEQKQFNTNVRLLWIKEEKHNINSAAD